MAVITKTIQPGEKSAEVTEIQKAFISLGATIAPGELFTATTAGDLRVILGGDHPLSEARRVHEDLLARRTMGKIILDPKR